MKQVRTRSPRQANPALQRRIAISTVERRGLPSARPRLAEFVARLNRFNPSAIRYRIAADHLEYERVEGGRLTRFDQDMIDFIDETRTVPLRFINRTGVFIDSFFFATVDIDDLLGGSDVSFQLNLLHILTERFATRDYARRRPSLRTHPRPHRLGLVRERDHLREVLSDPTIRYTGERGRGPNQYVFTFRSARGYRIEHLFTASSGGVSSGSLFHLSPGRVTSEVFIIQDGERLTIAEFLARRGREAEAE